MNYSNLVDIRDLTLARIRRLRNEKRYSQASAAARAGVNQQTWARWESGQVGIDLETLQNIARVLETTPEALIATESPRTDISTLIAEHLENLSEDDKEEMLEFVKLKERRLREKQDAYRADPEADSKKFRTRLSGSQSKTA